jgi:TonB family protein
LFTREARIEDEKGIVNLQATIDTSGKLFSIELVHSSGSPELDAAALKGYKRCKYRIKFGKNGVPKQVKYSIEVRFNMDN